MNQKFIGFKQTKSLEDGCHELLGEKELLNGFSIKKQRIYS